MSNKKNIDRLFQEKFKDFEAKPNDSVWKGIEAKLQDKEKKKRRVIPFWWTLGGAAAAVILLFTIGNLIVTDNNSNQPSIVDVDNIEVNEKQSPNKNLEDEDVSVASQNENSKETLDEETSNKNSTLKTDNSTKPSKYYYQEEAAIAFQKTKENNQDKEEDKKDYTTKTTLNKTQTTVVKSEPLKNSENNKTILKSKNEANTVSNFDIKSNAVASNDNSNSNSKTNSYVVSKNKNQLKSDEDIKKALKSSTKTEHAVATSKTSNSNKSANTKPVEELIAAKDEKIEEKKQSIEDAIAEANTEDETEEEIQKRRWSIAPNIAPVYFNSLGKGSSLDAQFIDNTTSSDITMSYGVKGSYAINDRLKITTGINRVSFNSITNDVITLSDKGLSVAVETFSTSSEQPIANNNNLSNVQLNSSNSDGSLLLLSRNSLNQNSVPEAINATSNGDLSQNFGFIEIPLEVDYRLIDKKLGVNISGGFSTLLLNENEIFAEVNGENSRIGKANNINDTSFSANFGIGLDYSISKKVNINLEPKFKYQLNTFRNTAGDFRPFFIGVYTGLSFKF